MDTVPAAPDASSVIPAYPPFLRSCVRRRIEQLEARYANFRSELAERFRLPLRVAWAKDFWRGVGSGPGSLEPPARAPKQASLARRAKIPQSAVSRGRSAGQLSLEMLIAVMKELKTPWEGLPPIPASEALHIECYTEAISFAQQQHDKWFSPKCPSPEELSRRAFECLLWLFRELEWFLPATPQSRRDAIAAAIGARVQKRLERATSPQAAGLGVAGGSLPDEADVEFSTHVLREYQCAFGAGWMLAVECIPYRWEVCREQHP